MREWKSPSHSIFPVRVFEPTSVRPGEMSVEVRGGVKENPGASRCSRMSLLLGHHLLHANFTRYNQMRSKSSSIWSREMRQKSSAAQKPQTEGLEYVQKPGSRSIQPPPSVVGRWAWFPREETDSASLNNLGTCLPLMQSCSLFHLAANLTQKRFFFAQEVASKLCLQIQTGLYESGN